MWWLARLAWHNFWRQRQRNLIASGALAVGVASYLLLDSMLASMTNESMTNFQRHTSGSAQIMASSYWQNRQYFPLNEAVKQASKLEQLARRHGWQVVPLIDFRAEVLFRNTKQAQPFNGVLPLLIRALPARQSVLPLADMLDEGEWLQANTSGLLLGAWLARDLGLEIGDLVNLRTRNSFGEITTDRLPLVGLLRSSDSTITRSAAYLPLGYARRLLEMPDGATSLLLSPPNTLGLTANGIDRKAAPLVDRLQPDLPPDTVLVGWQEIGRTVLDALESERSNAGVLLTLIVLLGGLGCWNTLMLSVYQRRRELAMLRALGMLEGKVRWLVLFESCFIGLLGALLGALLALPLNVLLIRYGIDYSGVAEGFRISGLVRGLWHWSLWLMVLVGAPILTLLAALLPAWSVSRQPLASSLAQRGAC